MYVMQLQLKNTFETIFSNDVDSDSLIDVTVLGL